MLFFGHSHAKSLQSGPTLCYPMDCSPPGSSVHGILQARILEWVAMSSSRGSSQPRDQTCVSYVSCIGRRFLYHECHLGIGHLASCKQPPSESSISPHGRKSPQRLKRHGFNPWVGKIPWRRTWQPTSVFLPGKAHGQRSLVGCSLVGCKESDTTEAT